MVISVKEATIYDLDTINKMAVDTFYETYSWYNTAEDMQTYTRENFNKEQIKKELEEKETQFFIAVIGNETVGYAKMRANKNPPELGVAKSIEIERIYVAQKFQKQKAGYALIKKCMEYAKKRKLDCMWLGVWKNNKRAIAFYERVGFKIFGTHVFRLGNDPQDDYLMKYDL